MAALWKFQIVNIQDTYFSYSKPSEEKAQIMDGEKNKSLFTNNIIMLENCKESTYIHMHTHTQSY